MKYYLATYGCQMNHSDSERIASVMESTGYKPSLKIEEADLIVANMCSVRQSAVDRIYGLANKIGRIKSSGKSITAILTGCLLQKDKRKLAGQFDFVLDIRYLPKWPNIIDSSSPTIFSGKDLLKKENYFKIRSKSANNFSALVPIMTGCNNFCAYCVVPHAKGREASRPAKEVMCETENLIRRGYKEIWLLGQNVNSYKGENKTNFPKLLKKISDIPGEFWVRFTSSHPKDFSDELIKTLARGGKITPYLNLPIQAGDDKILKKMNRPYTVTHYKNLVKKIRKSIPEITLSTDVIVGFPGETKKQFENTAKTFEEIKFDMAYIAEYSTRPQTLASKMNDDVTKKEKKSRKKFLNEILKKTALKKNKKYVGKEVEALISEKKSPDTWVGKTRSYKTIQVKSSNNLLGKFIKAKIVSASPWGLEGKKIRS